MAQRTRVSIDGIDDADVRRAATDRALEAVILELYRLGRVSSGRAARDLGISRVEFLNLATSREIATIQTTADELEEEVASFES